MKESPKFEFENGQEKKENKGKFEVYSNNELYVKALKKVADSMDFPPVTIIDLQYSKENKTNERLNGENYGELKKLIQEKVEKEEASVILSSFDSLEDCMENVVFYALLGYKKVGFMKQPFELTEIAELAAKLNEAPNIKDELVEKLSNQKFQSGSASHLRHDFSNETEKIIIEVNQNFDTNFDPKKDQAKARDFLDKFLDKLRDTKSEKKFEGKELKGIFCDVEGTLVDSKTGKINQEVLKKLDDYDKKEFVHVWTGGDVEKARELISKENRAWPVLSKQEFEGSIPEIVIDDLSENEFEKQYGIKPQNFINVKEIDKKSTSKVEKN